LAATLPIEIYEILEKKVSKEDAKEVIQVIESSFDAIEKKAEAVALQKKLEIKDELTKELATKADIAHIEGEIALVREEMKNWILRLDRKFTIMFVILFFTIIFLNQNALEFLAKVLGLIKEEIYLWHFPINLDGLL
jgi:hypothetical protein